MQHERHVKDSDLRQPALSPRLRRVKKHPVGATRLRKSRRSESLRLRRTYGSVRDQVRNQRSRTQTNSSTSTSQLSSSPHVALLTGGGDKPYALGMAAALTSAGIFVDFIGSDDLSVPELFNNPRVNFLNLRGRSTDGCEPFCESAASIKVLRTTHWLCSHGATKAVSHTVEQ